MPPAFGNEADADRSAVAVTTIPLAGNRRSRPECSTCAAREGATAARRTRSGTTRSTARTTDPVAVVGTPESQNVHNTVKARCLMPSKEKF